jgi:RHS repeat-associated protein
MWLNGLRVTVGAAISEATYDYDNDGLMIRADLALPAGGTRSMALTRAVDNGTLQGSVLGVVADEFQFNTFGEPSEYLANADGVAVFHAIYGRDKLGRVTTKTETVAGLTSVTDYGYDLAGRLETVSIDGVLIASYAYDANSNRRQITSTAGVVAATFDDQDRLLSHGSETLTYNQSGQLVERSGGSVSSLLEYDVLGNLRRVDISGGTQVEYVFDGLNRRIGRKLNGVLTQGFLFANNLKPVAELDGTGALVSTFVYADSRSTPSFMHKAGHTYRIITDHLGSPRLVIDVDSGAIAQRIDYDSWGAVLLDTNPGFQPFGFSGGLYDRATQLLRFGARDYDPSIARWLSKDPARFRSDLVNLYTYAASDPINLVDNDGLQVDVSYNQRFSIYQEADQMYTIVPDEISVSTHWSVKKSMPQDHRYNSDFPGTYPVDIEPEKMARDIRKHPRCKPGIKVRLFICNAGKGENSFAQKLKEALGGENPVFATEHLAILSSDGTGGTVIDANGDWMANPGEPSGTWREF